jgi:thiol-disulfide isomerase/thioredoxin
MKRISLAVALVSLVSALPRDVAGAEAPADRVVVMYFHRTVRCPTCQMMGTYSEEAVKQGFAEQVGKGTVEFHYVDFQNAQNAALAQGYKVAGPALIVVQISEGKAKQYKDLKEIWVKVRDKPAFLQFVRENVQAFVK